jgi:small subunit ribosomal protein S20
MPITKSAKKALRQNIKRRQRNLRRKSKIKELQKEFKNLLLEKKVEEAKKLLPSLYKAIDKAAKAGTIKKNTASRKKSRLAKSLQKASGAKQ